ncbi:cupin domain-containing protein [Paracoccus sp. (in: a-proteobacteria)]|uniref:cupin domain-containing protein n=1 Tax=Paracoccus sp. TaxID=267 RepID=UPI00289E3759|nr:cupin domain-containing protein [Paracoccus sp. (in: a-proteobacteria)]
MRINDDFDRPIIVHGAKLDWIASPAAGVERRMLFRIGDEIARATSIVRYAPGSSFPRHTHSGGEEILVLQGTFQDEHGDYPAGSYFRNPPGTSHIPAAAEGCVIFVRLWQYRTGDRVQINRQPGEGTSTTPRQGALSARILFQDEAEEVRIEDWAADAEIHVENPRGLEFILIDGTARLNQEESQAQSWGRLPAGQDLLARTGPSGATIWLRDGAALHPDVLPMPQIQK